MSYHLALASFVLLVLSFLFPTLFLLTRFLGPKDAGGKTKNSPYESGISSPIGTSDGRFHTSFYLVAILFVLVDVEIVFMLPWALVLNTLGVFGLSQMLVFIGLLFTALIYLYRSKALVWN